MSNIEKQLSKLFKKLNNKSSEPDQAWLSSTRDSLAQHMKANPKAQVEHFQPRSSFWHNWLFKPATIIAVALIVLLGGGTTFMAQAAEPGETLYPLKLAGENFNISIQVSPEAKARLYMKYADRRLGEFERLYEKRPEDQYWQEKVSGELSKHMVKAKDNMETLNSDTKYADIALSFEALTAKHQQRMAELEQKLNTSTVLIINHQQELNDLHRQKALQALEHAQELIKQHNGSQAIMQQRLEARLELLRARQEVMKDRLNQKLENLDIDKPALRSLDEGWDDTKGDELKNIRIYQEEIDDDGLHFESVVGVEGEGSEELETYIDVNNGQVIIDTSIQATGSSIFLHETQTINASSNQRIEVKGQQIKRK
jgi:vacuolar-type H+-ATPase subunit E/Vma4